MLMRFIAENFACFGDEVTLSLVAATADRRHPHHLIEKQGGAKLKVLRTAGLYGANGHGKTKLVDAIAFLQNFILEGVKPSADIPAQPFRLSQAKRQAPTRFEAAFHHQDIDYDYGLILDQKRVHEEWLFSRAKSKETLLFERTTDEKGTVQVVFGPSLKRAAKEGFLQYVAQGLRPNQSLLSECAERNVPLVTPAYEWFAHKLVIISPTGLYDDLIGRLLSEQAFLEFTADLLKSAGVGIERINVETTDIDKSVLPGQRYEEVKKFVTPKPYVVEDREGVVSSVHVDKEGGELVATTINVARLDDHGEEILFHVSQESTGTRRLMNLAPVIYNLGSKEHVYIMDELDRALHPILSYNFVKFFLERSPSGTKGQLIFTTHNTHLLDTDLLRRDEIWFVEKRPDGASDLYSLANFKIRPDLELEKGYLQGRFGALPFMGDIKALGWTKKQAPRTVTP